MLQGGKADLRSDALRLCRLPLRAGKERVGHCPDLLFWRFSAVKKTTLNSVLPEASFQLEDQHPAHHLHTRTGELSVVLHARWILGAGPASPAGRTFDLCSLCPERVCTAISRTAY